MTDLATGVALAPASLRIGLILLIAGVLLAPLVLRVSERAFDPFEPIWIFAAVYGAMFVVRPSAMLIRGDLVYEGPLTAFDIAPAYTKMLVVGVLGAVGFVGGYLSPAGTRLARVVPVLQGPRDIRLTGLVAFFLGAAGVVAFAIALASAHGLDSISLFLAGRSVELQETLAAPSFYPWAASFVLVPSTIVVAATATARRSRRLALLAVPLAGALLLRALPTGNRLLLLPFLGALFVLYFLRRQTRPSVGLLLVVAAAAIIGSAVLSDFRGRGDREDSAVRSVGNVLTHPTRAVEPFTTGPDTEMAATLAAALKVIPRERSHTFGSTIFGDLATRPIPRPLWPEKPESPREKLVRTIWPVQADRGTLNPEFSVLLYFFWDFSYVGVLLGLALYGLLTRALFDYFSFHSAILPVQVLFALAIWFLPMALRDSPVDTTINLAFGLAPVPLMFWLGGVVERRMLRPRVVT
jgi:hypothetical protein